MDISRFILSEEPNALDGALEWLDKEIENEADLSLPSSCRTKILTIE